MGASDGVSNSVGLSYFFAPIFLPPHFSLQNFFPQSKIQNPKSTWLRTPHFFTVFALN